VFFLLLSSYVVRNIASISKDYLLDQTPIEVIVLVFLLVVVYAVSGSRVGLLRLNMLFLPIIILATIFILLFSLKAFDFNNLLPMFKTSLPGYVKGIKSSLTSYIGAGIILFYIAFVKNPPKAPKAAVIGMSIPIILYVMIYLTSIGVFGDVGTANLVNPAIELAKRVEIPGMLLERVESLFFIIWLMAIFTTAAMAFDITVLAISSVLKKTAKIKIILILAPIHYYISMFPQDFIQVSKLGTILGYTVIIFSVSVTVLLLLIAKIRGVKSSE
jgi:spore germination protein